MQKVMQQHTKICFLEQVHIIGLLRAVSIATRTLRVSLCAMWAVLTWTAIICIVRTTALIATAAVCPVVYLPASVKITVSTDSSNYHQSDPHEVK